MKIEKLNDHQIRCTLTKEDLAKRHLNLSELAYGTEKTRALFQDMMTQASIDFGFEAEDIPLMIEAIPLSPEKIVLIITKVDSPDELDTRFSNFTHPEDYLEDPYQEENLFSRSPDTESDLTDLLNEIKNENQIADEQVPPEPAVPERKNQTRHFTCKDMNDVIEAVQMIHAEFQGESSLFKDPKSGQYHLFVHQMPHTAPEYNRFIHMLSNYLKKESCTQASEAYCAEHFQLILGRRAVQMLAGICE